MPEGGSTAQRPVGAVHTWLDALRRELGASRWSVAVREGSVWNVRSDDPSLHDGLISQLLGDERRHRVDRSIVVDVAEIGDVGERLRATGLERLLIVPGGPDARIILDAPDLARAQEFVASPAGLGTTFDLAGALQAEQLAGDLIILSDWWPEEGPPPSTATLEGTLLAGRMAVNAGSVQDAAVETRRNALLRERARIASVIHEGITQVLTNVAVQLEVIRHVSQDPEQLQEIVDSSRHAVLQALESLRTVIFDLTPPDEEWTDLAAGLDGFVADFAGQWGLQVRMRLVGEARDLDAEIVSMGFAFVQEALTNVRRHAQATSATVTLTYDPDHVSIEVLDDGIGLQDRGADEDLRPHQGLSIVESRARLLDGRLEIVSTPGAGTAVRVEVPA